MTPRASIERAMGEGPGFDPRAVGGMHAHIGVLRLPRRLAANPKET